MRRVLALAAVAAVAVAIPASTASGITATKFGVVGVTKFINVNPHRVIVKGVLVKPHQRGVQVGAFKILVKGKSQRPPLRIAFIFPDGKIKAKGPQNAKRLQVTGGTRAWNGVAGKVKARSRGERTERYTLTLVR